MPRAFGICYLKSLCIFPNELKLPPKIPQISWKCLAAKFRGRFRQVQQVNVKEKNYGQFPEVFIKLYKKFWAISTIKWQRKKICRNTKKLQFDRVILRPGWNLPYMCFSFSKFFYESLACQVNVSWPLDKKHSLILHILNLI